VQRSCLTASKIKETECGHPALSGCLLLAQELYAEATADPCQPEELGTFTRSFHIGAIFAVLVASALGAVFPLVLGIYREHPTLKFAIVLGKCMGTGVILAVGFIHMLMVSFSLHGFELLSLPVRLV
jgi:hypothetical protein